jgi:ADP-ribose pyrophosphatase YjhB (NUDIX family)
VTEEERKGSVLAAAAVVVRRDGRVLLIQRGRPPYRGVWTLPGGRVEAGEDGAAAAAREVREETGLEIRVIAFLETVVLDGPPRFAIHEFLAEPATDPDAIAAADDAAQARWVSRGEMDALGVNVEALGVVDRAIAARRAERGS